MTDTATPHVRVRRNTGGFTLIELMIALMLAAIISLCIAKISTDAQVIYDTMTTKVELYQKFRYALGDMKSEIESWQPTANLEFYVDQENSQLPRHWDEGEEIKGVENLSGGRPGRYDEAAMIIERQYEYIPEVGNKSEFHDAFTLYFKAPTHVKGQLRVANIEYYIADLSVSNGKNAPPVGDEVDDQTFKNLSLVKVVRWLDTDKDDFFKVERTVKMKVVELCQRVIDLRIEYFYDNEHDSKPGAYIVPSDELLKDKVKPEFKPRKIPGLGLVKYFMYGGFEQNRALRGKAILGRRNAAKAEWEPVQFQVGTATSGVNFSELAFGDEIYIWREQGRSGSFSSGDYTVFRKDSGRLEFVEPIDSTTWDGDQTGLRVKAGYVPSSVRIFLTVLNQHGRKPRTLQLVVRMVRKRA